VALTNVYPLVAAWVRRYFPDVSDIRGEEVCFKDGCTIAMDAEWIGGYEALRVILDESAKLHSRMHTRAS